MADPHVPDFIRFAILSTLLSLLTLLSGCSGFDAVHRFRQTAEDLGLQRRVISGTTFHHVVFQGPVADPNQTLHVYLDGDGTPWRDLHTIAADPTPNNPLTLRLLALDPGSAVYLGRPCYHGYAQEPSCDPDLWTYARYGWQVLDSLEQALQRVLKERPHRGLVLIGFSGGGTLALLLARRFKETAAVITVAGNLDIEAWTELHGYTPLSRSLNPATQPALPDSVLQRHYLGTKDHHVPPSLSRAYGTTHPAAELIEFADAGHTEGWEQHWPGILMQLQTDLLARRADPKLDGLQPGN